MKYNSDYNTVYDCKYHVIFTTKYRRKLLKYPIDVSLKEIILEKQIEYNYNVIELEVMYDHVHLLIQVNPKYSIKLIISKIKGYSSKYLRNIYLKLKYYKHLWTPTVFINTVGAVSLETVKLYIENQKC